MSGGDGFLGSGDSVEQAAGEGSHGVEMLEHAGEVAPLELLPKSYTSCTQCRLMLNIYGIL